MYSGQKCLFYYKCHIHNIGVTIIKYTSCKVVHFAAWHDITLMKPYCCCYSNNTAFLTLWKEAFKTTILKTRQATWYLSLQPILVSKLNTRNPVSTLVYIIWCKFDTKFFHGSCLCASVSNTQNTYSYTLIWLCRSKCTPLWLNIKRSKVSLVSPKPFKSLGMCYVT